MMLLLAVLTAAHASTYGATLYVPDQAPVGMPSSTVFGNGATWEGIAAGEPDVVVASDFAHVTCAVENGDVNVTFSATPNDYPMVIPSTATCAYGGYTLNIDLIPITPNAYTSMDFVPTVGVSYDLAPTVGSNPLAQYHIHKLPSTASFVEAPGIARLSPTQVWSGVECGVSFRGDNGEPRLWTWIHPNAVAGSGYCLVNSTSGVPYAIPVAFTR